MSGRLLQYSLIALLFCAGLSAQTEDTAVERSYPFSVEAVQKALQHIGGFGGGKLPILDGFVTSTPAELEGYDHPYFQYRVHFKPVDANNTLVSVEAKISALHANQDPARSEYVSLPSNGRLESDLHDRLQAALRNQGLTPSSQPKGKDTTAPGNAEPQVARKIAGPSQAELDAVLAERESVREKAVAVQAQIEKLRTADSAPSNAAKLASVKRSGVGVMSRENFGGPVLFRAQAEDEFEVVQLESGWAQVRLSPDSTAYIQADELNLPSGIVEKAATAQVAKPQPASTSNAPDLGFSVSREDVTEFSGDWARLKGKRALFVYVQPRGLLSDMAGEDAKLGYAKRVFESRYRTVTQAKTDVQGVVVVFLGSRGGVAAATLADIRQWIEGGLADDAFVNRCSLDPPTEFRSLRLN